MRYLYTVVLILFIAGSAMAGDFRTVKNLSLDAAQINSFEVEAGSGFLHILGREGAQEISITAEIEILDVSDDEAKRIMERDLELSLRQNGKTAVLISSFRGRSGFFSRYSSAHVNLTVEVPAEIELYIDDGSGEMQVSDMAADIEIDDGSGSMELERIAGNVEIHDGSGSIDIDNIKGRLRIDDNSGSVTVAKVTGDVDIKDGSGSIKVREIEGNVVIDDGSGSIDISDVDEDVTIEDDGSGGVHISRVRGTIHRYDD